MDEFALAILLQLPISTNDLLLTLTQITELQFGYSYLTAIVFFGPTVTKKRSIFRVGDIMVLMANLGTNCTHSNTIVHSARVAMVPMLVGEFLSCGSEGA